MRDGVKLRPRTCGSRRRPAAIPVLLVRTPYEKTGFKLYEWAQYFARPRLRSSPSRTHGAGGDSEGTFDPFFFGEGPGRLRPNRRVAGEAALVERPGWACWASPIFGTGAVAGRARASAAPDLHGARRRRPAAGSRSFPTWGGAFSELVALLLRQRGLRPHRPGEQPGERGLGQDSRPPAPPHRRQPYWGGRWPLYYRDLAHPFDYGALLGTACA